MHVFARNRQRLEVRERVAADVGEQSRLVRADIEDLCALLRSERVETHGERHDLAGGTGSLEQPSRVGVEACGRRSIDIAHMGRVFAVGRGCACVDIADVERAVFDARQHVLRGFAQLDAKMIHEPQGACRIDGGEQRHLRVSRPAMHERAARVVADAAQHRRADARRADHRMRLAPERL